LSVPGRRCFFSSHDSRRATPHHSTPSPPRPYPLSAASSPTVPPHLSPQVASPELQHHRPPPPLRSPPCSSRPSPSSTAEHHHADRPLRPFSGAAFTATTFARAHRYPTTSELAPSTSSPANHHRLPAARLCHRGGPLSVSPNLPNSSNLSSPTPVMLLTPFPTGSRPPARRNQLAPPPPLFLRSWAEMPKGARPLGRAGEPCCGLSPSAQCTFLIIF
jgi:hypothetical protein